MSDKVYKLIELTGTSADSMEEAVQNAVSKAGQTVRRMSWFEVVETRGAITDNRVSQWQVTIKVGFALEA